MCGNEFNVKRLSEDHHCNEGELIYSWWSSGVTASAGDTSDTSHRLQISPSTFPSRCLQGRCWNVVFFLLPLINLLSHCVSTNSTRNKKSDEAYDRHGLQLETFLGRRFKNICHYLDIVYYSTYNVHHFNCWKTGLLKSCPGWKGGWSGLPQCFHLAHILWCHRVHGVLHPLKALIIIVSFICPAAESFITVRVPYSRVMLQVSCV